MSDGFARPLCVLRGHTHSAVPDVCNGYAASARRKRRRQARRPRQQRARVRPPRSVVESRCRLRKAPSRSDRRRPGQVDRGRRTPREEERPGAPGSASATPARPRNRQRPPRSENRLAQVVKTAFGRSSSNSSLDSTRFFRPTPAGEEITIFRRGSSPCKGVAAARRCPQKTRCQPSGCFDWRIRVKSWL